MTDQEVLVALEALLAARPRGYDSQLDSIILRHFYGSRRLYAEHHIRLLRERIAAEDMVDGPGTFGDRRS